MWLEVWTQFPNRAHILFRSVCYIETRFHPSALRNLPYRLLNKSLGMANHFFAFCKLENCFVLFNLDYYQADLIQIWILPSILDSFSYFWSQLKPHSDILSFVVMDFITVKSLLRWSFVLWKPELFLPSILYAILDLVLYFHDKYLSAQTLILVFKPCLTRALIG